MPETTETAFRLEKWPDDQIHRIRVSERMLTELVATGMTATAGTALVGPELLVLETVHDAEDAVETRERCDECGATVDADVGLCPECKDEAIVHTRGGDDG